MCLKSVGQRLKLIHYLICPFNVFRDLGRLAGLSYNDFDKSRSEIFEFLLPENLDKAKRLIIGAMFEEEFEDAGEALGRNDYDNDLARLEE